MMIQKRWTAVRGLADTCAEADIGLSRAGHAASTASRGKRSRAAGESGGTAMERRSERAPPARIRRNAHLARRPCPLSAAEASSAAGGPEVAQRRRAWSDRLERPAEGGHRDAPGR